MMKDPVHGYLNLLIMNFIPLLFVDFCCVFGGFL